MGGMQQRRRVVVLNEPLPPCKVRMAQLVLASVAFQDDEREPDLAEVLAAVGLLTTRGRIQRRSDRPVTGRRSQAGLPRDWREPGEREPNGRLSRRSRNVKIEIEIEIEEEK